MADWLKSIFTSEALVCDADIDVANLVLSVLVTVGILASYLPQHYKIISRRSSDGLSHWYLFLGATSMCALVVNALILQFGYFQCCQRLAAGLCIAKLMGLVQIGVQWIAYVVLYALFFAFYPPQRKHVHRMTDGKVMATHEWSRVTLLTTILITFFIAISTTAAVLLSVLGNAQEAEASEYFADALGLISMLCSTVQFMPQLIKTWRSKQVGALSIPSMLIQTPGSFLFVFTLATRPGINVTTWITYLITGVLQGCLLVMCICWHYRSKRLARQELLMTAETSPLLSIDDDDGDQGPIARDEKKLPRPATPQQQQQQRALTNLASSYATPANQPVDMAAVGGKSRSGTSSAESFYTARTGSVDAEK